MKALLKILPKSDYPKKRWLVIAIIGILLATLGPAKIMGIAFTSTAQALETDGEPKKDQGAEKLYEGYHALVVGIEEYDHWPARRHANKNAQEVAQTMQRLGVTVKLLTDPALTELQTALDDFVQQIEEKPMRGLIFYYCGNSHSVTMDDGRQIGWLIPKDSPLPKKNPLAFRDKAISTDKITALANQHPKGHLLLLMDTSFSATVFKNEKADMRQIGKTDTAPVYQFITSGKTGDRVSDNGAFHRFLLQGLGGEADLIKDDIVSGSELALFLLQRVSNVTQGKRQPQFGRISVNGDNSGDFLFQRGQPIIKKAQLFVSTQPTAAKTQVLNIKSRFKQGIKLIPGKYTLRVSAAGYESVDQSINLKAGEQRKINIDLPKIPTEATNSLGMQFIRIPKGEYMMGSPKGEPGRSIDETEHQVTLTQPFFMQHTEVTVGQFKQFVQATSYKSDAEKNGGCWITSSAKGWSQKSGTSWKKPGTTKIKDQLPAICITWNDAMAFARWLSAKEKKTYKLPTEAQWEYAGRAGITTPFSGGRCLSTDEANYGKIGHQYKKCATVFRKKRGGPMEVGQLTPNPWKLHDIHGNVAEWCLDWYGPYSSKKAIDPKGQATGSERVMRGGHWQADAAGCRTAARRRFPPQFAFDVVGFRLVMIP